MRFYRKRTDNFLYYSKFSHKAITAYSAENFVIEKAEMTFFVSLNLGVVLGINVINDVSNNIYTKIHTF